MGSLEQLRAKIAGFPGYDGELARRHSDEYVRAYLGEALTEFAARCELPPEVQGRLDDIVLRLEFADVRSFVNHRRPGKPPDAADGDALATADAATVELAERAASVDTASAPAYLDEVAAALDDRAAAIRAASLR